MENIDFEIQTLLQSTGYRSDDIKGTLSFDNDFPSIPSAGLVDPRADVWQPLYRRRHSSAPSSDGVSSRKKVTSQSSQDIFWGRPCHRNELRCSFESIGSDSDRSRSNSESEKSEEEPLVVRCPTLGTEYATKGIKPFEIPVIGTFVDPRIVTGFRYKVRQLGSKQHFFGGEALRLQSIGLGYGKRITFESSVKNYNPNFFWSDSSPEGFGFSIHVVSEGDRFAALTDEGRPAAEITVQDVICQKELSQGFDNGAVIKTIKITLVCDIWHMTDPHGMMPLRSSSTNTVIEGRVTLVKAKGAREAVLKEVIGNDVPFIGSCILYPMGK